MNNNTLLVQYVINNVEQYRTNGDKTFFRIQEYRSYALKINGGIISIMTKENDNGYIKYELYIQHKNNIELEKVFDSDINFGLCQALISAIQETKSTLSFIDDILEVL